MAFEIWFSYKGVNRFRVADDVGQRDDAVAYLNAAASVTAINVIDIED